MVDHILRTSLENNSIITIIYQKGREITCRSIRVKNISGDSVFAFCYLRNQNRVFKKENILSAAFQKTVSLCKEGSDGAGLYH